MEAEEAEEGRSREQTEAQEAVLEVVREMQKATTAMIAKAIGSNRGNMWTRVQALWRRGLLGKEMIGNVPHYYVKAEQMPLTQGEQ